MTRTTTSMRLFILGGTGGIGRQLVDQALERHHQVIAFVRSPEKLGARRDGLTVIQGDVRNPDAMSRLYRNPDGKSAVRVVQYESVEAHKAYQQDEALQQQVAHLRNFVESAVGSLYEEVRTTGDFK